MSIVTVAAFKNQLEDLKTSHTDFLKTHKALSDYILSDELLDNDKAFHEKLTAFETKILTSPDISKALMDTYYASQVASQPNQPQTAAKEPPVMNPTELLPPRQREISPIIFAILIAIIAIMGLFSYWSYSDIQHQVNLLQLSLLNSTIPERTQMLNLQISNLQSSQNSLLESSGFIVTAIAAAVALVVVAPKITDLLGQRIQRPKILEEDDSMKPLPEQIADKIENIRRRFKAEYFLVRIQTSSKKILPELSHMPSDVLVRKEQRLVVLRAEFPPILGWITVRVNEAVTEQKGVLNSFIVQASTGASSKTGPAA